MALKAVATSPVSGVYGVDFEHTYNGRKNWNTPSTYIPCASFAHAQAVVQAFNSVPTREPARNDVADVMAMQAVVAPTAAGMAKGTLEYLASQARPTTRSPLAEEMFNQYRGAPMGVADYVSTDVTPQDALVFGIRRITLDGGYSKTGVYWGVGNTLWHAAATQDGAIVASHWLRAETYAIAASAIRARYANALTQRVATL